MLLLSPRRWRRAYPYAAPIIGVLSLLRTFNLLNAKGVADAESYILPRIVTWNSLFFVLAIFLFFLAYVHFRHRKTPLTVVHTVITIEIETPKGDRATITRKQHIRANHDEVTGYFRKLTASSTGNIPRDLLHMSMDHCPDSEQTIHLEGDAGHSVEIMHRFAEIPRLLRRFGLNTVIREETAVVENSFTETEEFYEFSIPLVYPHKTVDINIHFHRDRIPAMGDCSALRIRSNGIQDLPLNRILTTPAGGQGVHLCVKGAPGDRYQIRWKQPPQQSQSEAAAP